MPQTHGNLLNSASRVKASFSYRKLGLAKENIADMYMNKAVGQESTYLFENNSETLIAQTT